MAVAFLPITAFYLGAIVFKLSVTSGSMVAYVLVCQLVSVPTLQRFLMQHEKINYSLLLTGHSLWNLDFLRSLYKPFCIHPRMTTLHVLALDYLVGVYPLFLIFLTYIAVKLHDHYIPNSLEASETTQVHQERMERTRLADTGICYVFGFILYENPRCLF